MAGPLGATAIAIGSASFGEERLSSTHSGYGRAVSIPPQMGERHLVISSPPQCYYCYS